MYWKLTFIIHRKLFLLLAPSICEHFGNENINYKQRKTELCIFFINIACVPDNDLLKC